MKNNINQIIIILRKIRLDQLKKYEQNGYFFIETHYIELVISNWRN